MVYDIVGDVHGQFAKLRALLDRLGYREHAGAWRCPGRTAVFVGDLIDRGPDQLETLDVVRRMMEAGTALCVMGNHEFNAVAWTLPNPHEPGEFLRPHRKPGNRAQHQAFLDAVESTPLHAVWIRWFKTLPLWLDFGALRVVHACWDQASIDALQPWMGPGQTLTDELFQHGGDPQHWAHRAIETLCKGPEVTLPPGLVFHDKDGKARAEVRVRWWESDLTTYRQAAIGPREEMARIPDEHLPASCRVTPYSGPPVVFGHYWFNGTPQVISDRFACVDYSAGAAGPLVAYRYEGEAELISAHLAWAPA